MASLAKLLDCVNDEAPHLAFISTERKLSQLNLTAPTAVSRNDDQSVGQWIDAIETFLSTRKRERDDAPIEGSNKSAAGTSGAGTISRAFIADLQQEKDSPEMDRQVGMLQALWDRCGTDPVVDLACVLEAALTGQIPPEALPEEEVAKAAALAAQLHARPIPLVHMCIVGKLEAPATVPKLHFLRELKGEEIYARMLGRIAVRELWQSGFGDMPSCLASLTLPALAKAMAGRNWGADVNIPRDCLAIVQSHFLACNVLLTCLDADAAEADAWLASQSAPLAFALFKHKGFTSEEAGKSVRAVYRTPHALTKLHVNFSVDGQVELTRRRANYMRGSRSEACEDYWAKITSSTPRVTFNTAFVRPGSLQHSTFIEYVRELYTQAGRRRAETTAEGRFLKSVAYPCLAVQCAAPSQPLTVAAPQQMQPIYPPGMPPAVTAGVRDGYFEGPDPHAFVTVFNKKWEKENTFKVHVPTFEAWWQPKWIAKLKEGGTGQTSKVPLRGEVPCMAFMLSPGQGRCACTGTLGHTSLYHGSAWNPGERNALAEEFKTVHKASCVPQK